MTWLTLKEDGSKQTLQLDKRQLITTTGLELPMRDMRLLDPAMQPFETVAQLLVRDNALVFSMEGARCVIMADKVMVPLEGEVTEQLDRFLQVSEGGSGGELVWCCRWWREGWRPRCCGPRKLHGTELGDLHAHAS
jgi:hypothetical protein